MEQKVNYKSLRLQQFSEDDYKDIIAFLTEEDIPVGLKGTNKTRFIKKAQQFKVDGDDLVLETHQKPPELKNVDIPLPLKFTVIAKNRVNEVLKTEWRNISSSSGLASGQQLYYSVRKSYIGITRKDCYSFVANQETIQLKSRAVEHIVIKPIVKEKPLKLWCYDLMDMSKYAGNNNQIHWLLLIIDHFSKFVWVRVLVSKSHKEVAYEFRQVLMQEGVVPESVLSDNEFKDSREMVELFNQFNINTKFTLEYRPEQNGACERANGTIKRRIDKFLTETKKTRYVDVLQEIVYGYNTSVHSTTQHSPANVHRRGNEELYEEVKQNTLKKAEKMIRNSEKQIKFYNQQTGELEVGNKVRLNVFATKKGRKVLKNPLSKKFRVDQFSKELYTVSEVLEEEDALGNMIKKYKLLTEQGLALEEGDQRKESYFRHELLKVDEELLMHREGLEVNGKYKGKKLPRLLEKAVDLEAKQEQTELEKKLEAEKILITKKSLRPRVSEERKDNRRTVEERYEVEKLLDHDEEDGERIYLIKWKNYDANSNSWEFEKNIDKRAVQAYWRRKRKTKN